MELIAEGGNGGGAGFALVHRLAEEHQRDRLGGWLAGGFGEEGLGGLPVGEEI